MLHLEIEATNRCNTRCLHCPHESVTRPLGKMEWSTFQTIMGKVFSSASDVSVEFAGMGEPLLNPLIYRFIGYISDRARTSLTTNASALTPQNIQRLIEAGLDRLTISFNGTDQDSYELMMGGLSFARAESHLHTAIEMSRGQRMHVAANISVTKQLQSRLAHVRDYLTRAGVQTIFFSKCHNRGGNLNDPAICDTPLPPQWASARCDIFTSTLFVAWNGDVLSCCHDLAGANKLGNLTTDDLQTILSQRQAVVARGVDFAICQRCNDMYRYMHAPTPDGSPLSEWIYALYASEDERTRKLTEHIRELEACVASQQETINTLNAQLAEIKRSRGWRLLTLLRRMRKLVAWSGSRIVG
jgi:sulfatase maturation enzyme AslB (radical SAM superfamily)